MLATVSQEGPSAGASPSCAATYCVEPQKPPSERPSRQTRERARIGLTAFEWSAQRLAGSTSARGASRVIDRRRARPPADLRLRAALVGRPRPRSEAARPTCLGRSKAVPQSVLGRPLRRLANNRHLLVFSVPRRVPELGIAPRGAARGVGLVASKRAHPWRRNRPDGPSSSRHSSRRSW